jgi:hypothetical protein
MSWFKNKEQPMSDKMQRFLQSRERSKFADYPYEVFIRRADIDRTLQGWLNEQRDLNNLIIVETTYSTRVRFSSEQTRTIFYLRWGNLE